MILCLRIIVKIMIKLIKAKVRDQSQQYYTNLIDYKTKVKIFISAIICLIVFFE